MLKPILIPALLLAAGAGPPHAQTDYYARAGAMWVSTLVRDVLVTEVTVQQSIAPMVALAFAPITPVPRRLERRSSGSYRTEDARRPTSTLRTGC
jgi:hypothetical protein